MSSKLGHAYRHQQCILKEKDTEIQHLKETVLASKVAVQSTGWRCKGEDKELGKPWKIQILNRRIQELEACKENLEKELSEQMEKTQEALCRAQTAHGLISEHLSNATKSNEELEKLHVRHRELNEKCHSLEADLEEAASKLNDSRKRNEDDKEHWRKETENVNQQLDDVNCKLKSTKEQVDQLQEINNDMATQNQNLLQSLEEAKAKLSVVKRETSTQTTVAVMVEISIQAIPDLTSRLSQTSSPVKESSHSQTIHISLSSSSTQTIPESAPRSTNNINECFKEKYTDVYIDSLVAKSSDIHKVIKVSNKDSSDIQKVAMSSDNHNVSLSSEVQWVTESTNIQKAPMLTENVNKLKLSSDVVNLPETQVIGPSGDNHNATEHHKTSNESHPLYNMMPTCSDLEYTMHPKQQRSITSSSNLQCNGMKNQTCNYNASQYNRMSDLDLITSNNSDANAMSVSSYPRYGNLSATSKVNNNKFNRRVNQDTRYRTSHFPGTPTVFDIVYNESVVSYPSMHTSTAVASGGTQNEKDISIVCIDKPLSNHDQAVSSFDMTSKYMSGENVVRSKSTIESNVFNSLINTNCTISNDKNSQEIQNSCASSLLPQTVTSNDGRAFISSIENSSSSASTPIFDTSSCQGGISDYGSNTKTLQCRAISQFQGNDLSTEFNTTFSLTNNSLDIGETVSATAHNFSTQGNKSSKALCGMSKIDSLITRQSSRQSSNTSNYYSLSSNRYDNLLSNPPPSPLFPPPQIKEHTSLSATQFDIFNHATKNSLDIQYATTCNNTTTISSFDCKNPLSHAQNTTPVTTNDFLTNCVDTSMASTSDNRCLDTSLANSSSSKTETKLSTSVISFIKHSSNRPCVNGQKWSKNDNNNESNMRRINKKNDLSRGMMGSEEIASSKIISFNDSSLLPADQNSSPNRKLSFKHEKITNNISTPEILREEQKNCENMTKHCSPLSTKILSVDSNTLESVSKLPSLSSSTSVTSHPLIDEEEKTETIVPSVIKVLDKIHQKKKKRQYQKRVLFTPIVDKSKATGNETISSQCESQEDIDSNGNPKKAAPYKDKESHERYGNNDATGGGGSSHSAVESKQPRGILKHSFCEPPNKRKSSEMASKSVSFCSPTVGFKKTTMDHKMKRQPGLWSSFGDDESNPIGNNENVESVCHSKTETINQISSKNSVYSDDLVVIPDSPEETLIQQDDINKDFQGKM